MSIDLKKLESSELLARIESSLKSGASSMKAERSAAGKFVSIGWKKAESAQGNIVLDMPVFKRSVGAAGKA